MAEPQTEAAMHGYNFDVKPCVKCGARDRHVSGACKPCAAAWAEKNKERVRAYKAAYYEKNKAEVVERATQWIAENRDAFNARSNERYKRNPEKFLAAARAWREKNRERSLATAKAWNAANPEARRQASSKRRALKRTSGASLSKGLIAKLFALQKGRCPCCRQPLGDDYHLDHIEPLARGGKHEDSNMQLLRSLCNRRKSAKHPIDFMQERGFLL